MKKLIYFLWMCIGYCTWGQAQDTTANDYILILNSVNFDEAWTRGIYETVVNNFDPQEIRIEAEELQVPTLHTLQEAEEKIQALSQKYSQRPKLIIFLGDPGWLTCRPLFDGIWKDVATIICYSRDEMPASIQGILNSNNLQTPQNMRPAREVLQGYNVTVLKQPFYIQPTLRLMQRLQPRMEKIGFICDSRYISICARTELQRIMKNEFPHLQLEVFNTPDISTEKLLNILQYHDDKMGIIYYSWFVPKTQNENYLADNIQKIVHTFSSSPVFTLSDLNAQNGNFAGGYYISIESFSSNLIATIHNILLGTEARNIPFSNGGEPAVYLNYLHLTSHNIPSELFPDNAVYYQYPPSFYEKYKTSLIATGLMICLVAVIIILRFHLYIQKQKRKDMEFTLLAQYHRMINNMPLIYIRKQLVTDTTGQVSDFIFLDVNSAFEKTFHCTRAQVIHKNWRSLLPLYPTLDHIREDKIGQIGIVEIPDTEGNFHYYDKLVFWDDEENIIDVFCIDKTEAHNARLNLEESHYELEQLNEKYKLALKAAQMSIWTWDLEKKVFDCSIEYIDKDIPELSQSKHILLDEKKYCDSICADDRKRIHQAYIALLEGKSPVMHETFRTSDLFFPDTQIWLESYALIGKRDANGKPLTLVGVSIDITHQKEMERELLEKEKIEQASHLKSAFLANMSHEIRTPLNAIVGFSNLLVDTDTPEEKKEYAAIIENNNALLLQLINDILDLSKIEAGTLDFAYSAVDINLLFQEIEQSTRLRPHSPAVTIRFEEYLPECILYTERNRLTQVITNFLNNSLKFTKQGVVLFGYRKAGDMLYFYVKDTGCGIPPDKIDQIFGRFVKLNSFEQGTGLGLSICETIIQKMGGNIGVESEEGHGSIFWFTLPYHPNCTPQPQTLADNPRVPAPTAKETQAATILIAEDNIYNFKLLDSILKQHYTLLHAWDGEQAVALFGKHRPDLILMDIKMPRLDGFDATAQIRTLSPDVPILAITAYAFSENEAKIRKNGFNDYIAKPINTADLNEKITLWLAHRTHPSPHMPGH